MNKLFEFLDELINKAKEEYHTPGIVVNLISKGDIVYTKSLGVSQIGVTDKPITPETIFVIMSIAKSFTSTAVMQLVQQGNLKLDDPISRYLPYFQVRDSAFSHQITIKQLLSHTAGFPDDFWIASLQDHNLFSLIQGVPDYQGILKQFPKEVLETINNREDVTRYFSNSELIYEPGQGWKYCTDAYVIVGDILEKVTGLSWEEYIQVNIINRLELNRTFTDPSRLNKENDITNYYTTSNSNIVKLPTPINQICAPAGFIYSTVNDLSLYIKSHMDLVENPLLDTSSLNSMQDMIAKRQTNLSYGLGWKVRITHGHKIVEHAGGYPGVATYVVMIPSEGFGIVLFSNCDKVPVQDLSEKAIEYYIKEIL